RASWHGEAHMGAAMHAPDVATDAKGKVTGKLEAHGQIKSDIHVQAPEVHVQAPDVKAHVDVATGAAGKAAADAKAAANASANAATKVEGAVKASVKAPEVHVQAPSVKIEGHAKGSFKLSN